MSYKREPDTELELEIVPDLWATDNPNAWMVYADHPEGGSVTMFHGTKAECEEFLVTRRPTLRLKGKLRREPPKAGKQ